VLAEPNRATAIGVPLDGRVDRHECRRAVVLRPIELNATGDPGAQQPDQGWLDNVLTVKEVVLVRLVEPREYSSANLRQEHQLNVFVLEEIARYVAFTFSRATRSVKGLGYTLPVASLIYPILEEHGFGSAAWIG